MKKNLISVITFLKGLVLLIKPHVFLSWIKNPMLTISNILNLSQWVSEQDKKDIFNDFYTPFRDYAKREKLYDYVITKLNLKNEAFDYLEFGVCEAISFKWWLQNCSNIESRFYGFDTFEGLPENWGLFLKGDMAANVPMLDDNRAKFIKGLFQETVGTFLQSNNLNNGKRKIIHLDADLFSSTIFALTSLAPYLKKGDVLIFDEFNVPNHEFYAFKIFSESYYVKTKLLAAVNNYYQVAFIIE
jgi:hypothetical protein